MPDMPTSQDTTVVPDGAVADIDPALARAARQLAAQGTVLLRNAHHTLPLATGTRVALFGRAQKDWIAVGYGSGGDVRAPYSTNLVDSLIDGGDVRVDAALADWYAEYSTRHPADPGDIWGEWHSHYPEPAVDPQQITDAALRNDVAIVVIARAAGEDRDAELTAGSYYLTEEERSLLEQVTAAFTRTVVVVDTGGLIDMSWADEMRIDAIVLAWFGGMEGGRATAEVLTGIREPGGRLTATIPTRYEDCPGGSEFGRPDASEYTEDIFVGYRYFETFAPGAVRFPFGFGLAYTTFERSSSPLTITREDVSLSVSVTNSGKLEGSDVLQLYVEKPLGALSQPSRELVAFARTPLLRPGERSDLALTVPWRDLASYDDAGATGYRNAFVLEAGEYTFHLGTSVRETDPVGTARLAETRVVEQLEEAAAPTVPFRRMTHAVGARHERHDEPVPLASTSLKDRILARLPEAVRSDGAGDMHGDDAGGVRWEDVRAGAADLESFIASLSLRELSDLTYGDVVMDSPLGPAGNAGVFGGVSEELRQRGVPPVVTTDGPSGIRISAFASLLPSGTALASTWNPVAVEELAALHAQEMVRRGSDVLLAPGMNIQRNPLCGRNFEYYSEDPFVSGCMGAAQVRGIQSGGVTACPKHFACNNQEYRRIHLDARVSQRALREIYLRGFRIVVETASPGCIMTSYNKVNGVWSHYHYDLVTTILRGEWHFSGTVITDWWMRMAEDPNFPALRDSAYRVRAGVDVLMPGGIEHNSLIREDTVFESAQREDGLTLGELQRTARHVLSLLLHVDPQGHRMAQGGGDGRP